MYLWVGGKWNVRPDESCGVCVCVCVCVLFSVIRCNSNPLLLRRVGIKTSESERKKKERQTERVNEREKGGQPKLWTCLVWIETQRVLQIRILV